jgi:hypothetical protein
LRLAKQEALGILMRVEGTQQELPTRIRVARITMDYGSELEGVGRLAQARSQFEEAERIAPPGSEEQLLARSSLRRLPR